jgi:transcriptional regulator GlxA family with amidase domain
VWHVLHLVEAALSDGAPFRAGDAAKSLGLSLHHLGVLFRQATGHTMTTYYRNRRVQEAKRLLLDQQLSVAHVAHAVGFYDAAQLCRHFRVAVGESPAVYRRRYIGAQASVDIGEASPAVTFPR